MTVGDMLQRMSSAELAEWRAFERIEPFGGHVEDFRAGLYPALKANAHRGEGKDRVTPSEFFPWHAEPKQTASDAPEAVEKRLTAFFDHVTEGSNGR